MRSWHAVEDGNEVCFFDRGIPDIAGYLTLCHLPVPQHIEKAIDRFRYAADVFIAPPWRDIFVQDPERKQSFDEAELTYHAMVATYRKYGYRLRELPRAPAEARAEFIMANLSNL